jgi:hypothetical protein
MVAELAIDTVSLRPQVATRGRVAAQVQLRSTIRVEPELRAQPVGTTTGVVAVVAAQVMLVAMRRILAVVGRAAQVESVSPHRSRGVRRCTRVAEVEVEEPRVAQVIRRSQVVMAETAEVVEAELRRIPKRMDVPQRMATTEPTRLVEAEVVLVIAIHPVHKEKAVMVVPAL